MRIPDRAPTTKELFSSLVTQGGIDADELAHIVRQGGGPAPGGRYRHWHKLKYLPLPEGLTHQTWWLAIKLARNFTAKSWPLKDLEGNEFQFGMPDIASRMVHAIDRKASGSFETADLIPAEQDRRLYLIRSLEEEAITSSQLEGAATTRKAAKKMLRERRTPSSRSERMILNNYNGMKFIAQRAKDTRLTRELIFELHGILTEDTLDDPHGAGRFRRDDKDIVVMDQTGQTLHKPPPESELSERLQAMCDFANSDADDPFIHPVVRSILLHFWLAYDHPFVDGNGRTARALFYWSMARHGYWLIEYVSISRLLMKAKADYTKAFLYVETDENDATYFVLHQCRIILRAIDELHLYLKRKIEERNQSRDLLRTDATAELGLNHRQLAVVRHGLDHPGSSFTIQGHRHYHNISYQTARTDLLGLADVELLMMSKVGREFRFVAPDDLGVRIMIDEGME